MSNKKKHNRPHQSFFQRHRGNVVYFGILGGLLVFALWALIGHLKLAAISSSDSATNPIGVQTSAHPSETDIASLQAAERGSLQLPALAWFHADW